MVSGVRIKLDLEYFVSSLFFISILNLLNDWEYAISTRLLFYTLRSKDIPVKPTFFQALALCKTELRDGEFKSSKYTEG